MPTFLFIHQNFPGQFRHVVRALADDPNNRVVGIGDAQNISGRPSVHAAVEVFSYTPHRGAHASTHHYVRDFEGHVCRGQAVIKLLFSLKEKGLYPDVIVAHPGWGEALFLRDVFPSSRHIYYLEFFYRSQGSDIAFDPEFPTSIDQVCKVRVKNNTQLYAALECDVAISPTEWQKAQYPAVFRDKIHVLHEGVDTDFLRPDAEAWIELGGRRFKRGDPVVTYLARNLEPYRGFHSFMRSIEGIQRRCPEAVILIVGGDDVSYGARLPDGKRFRDMYRAEVESQVDWSRVFFSSRVSYELYLRILQVSAAHVYLTYPFVLSWSLIEAMSVGCAIVASRTPPVEEVIDHERNGLLVDIFDYEAIAAAVANQLRGSKKVERLRQAARASAVKRFDLKSVCLPRAISLISSYSP